MLCRSAIINYDTIGCIITRVITGIFLTKLRVNENQFVNNFDSGVIFGGFFFLCGNFFYADLEKKTAKIRTHKNLVPHGYSVDVRPRVVWIIP